MADLPYLASRLYGTPLLIARPKLDVILGVKCRDWFVMSRQVVLALLI